MGRSVHSKWVRSGIQDRKGQKKGTCYIIDNADRKAGGQKNRTRYFIDNVSMSPFSFPCPLSPFSLVFVWCHEFSNFDAVFCHSAVNFTTLGYGDIVMSLRWRRLGPIEAMNGTLMSGLSAAILFSALHRLVDRRLAIPQSAHRLISAESPMKRLGGDPNAQGNEGI